MCKTLLLSRFIIFTLMLIITGQYYTDSGTINEYDDHDEESAGHVTRQILI